LDFIGALLFYIFEFIGDLLTPSVGPTSVGNSGCGRDMRIFDRSLRGIRILRAMRLGAALVLSYLHWRAKPLGRQATDPARSSRSESRSSRQSPEQHDSAIYRLVSGRYRSDDRASKDRRYSRSATLGALAAIVAFAVAWGLRSSSWPVTTTLTHLVESVFHPAITPSLVLSALQDGMDIYTIILAALAVIIVLRLRSVLRRTLFAP
jgi:hypothetical protein